MFASIMKQKRSAIYFILYILRLNLKKRVFDYTAIASPSITIICHPSECKVGRRKRLWLDHVLRMDHATELQIALTRVLETGWTE